MLCYSTPSFIVLFLKREICLLLWMKSYLQKLKKKKNKNEPVWLIKSPKCKFNLYHALFFSAGQVTNPTRCAMHIAIFFVIRLKNSRSTISIPMNKNLFPSDFFFQVSLNVFLHSCEQWDFFSTCIFDQDMTLLPTIFIWCHGSLQREIHSHSVHYGHFGGGKLLMDFKITIKWSI